jgi:hypothetical protein
VSRVQRQLRARGELRGGGLGYPLEQLFEEVAYIAYHFHWSPAQILSLEHRDRRQWIDEIARINRRLNEEG